MKHKIKEEWTGVVVGKMHQFGITNKELGDRCGYTTQYISMLLNGKKKFKNLNSKEKTKNRVLRTLDEIIQEVSYE